MVINMKFDTSKLTLRPLTEESIPTLLDIQEETFAAAEGDTAFLRRNTAQTLAPCFSGDSCVLGAYLEDEMVAFGMLYAAGEDKENLAKDVDMITDMRTSANVKLTIVRPKYRGNGIQRLLINSLAEHAKRKGYVWLCTTVAPENKYSMNNCLACGFTEYKILQKYGGLTRALLVKKIGE